MATAIVQVRGSRVLPCALVCERCVRRGETKSFLVALNPGGSQRGSTPHMTRSGRDGTGSEGLRTGPRKARGVERRPQGVPAGAVRGPQRPRRTPVAAGYRPPGSCGHRQPRGVGHGHGKARPSRTTSPPPARIRRLSRASEPRGREEARPPRGYTAGAVVGGAAPEEREGAPGNGEERHREGVGVEKGTVTKEGAHRHPAQQQDRPKARDEEQE